MCVCAFFFISDVGLFANKAISACQLYGKLQDQEMVGTSEYERECNT